MSRIVLYPYKMKSEAGILLSEALDALRVYPDRDYKPKAGDLIVNWGNGWEPKWSPLVTPKVRILNHWNAICLSVNKVETFRLFKKDGVPSPKWTTHGEVAKDWLEDGHWVCCRTEVEGKDGSGLHLAKSLKEFKPAALYTRYIPIEREYRVYIFDGKMFDILEKRRDSDALKDGKVNEHIRTESNNWVFCRQHLVTPKDAEKVAAAAIAALGLQFGGVDVVLSKQDGKCYALETNTAPGIAGTTVARLADHIKKLAK